jgi:ABC-type multidrug transport system ATPase subunit
MYFHTQQCDDVQQVRDHVLFYARLKGTVPKDENTVVNESLGLVALEPFADRLTKNLSGGERRRLSIAISLVGSPELVFLDEPTVKCLNLACNVL